MKIFPAIDIKDGKAVRLFQGDYNKMTVYSSEPADVAKGFRKAGATNLHIVDLDGAKDGKLINFQTIRSIIDATDMFVEVGGGIRDEERIGQYIKAGAGRVILGTIAVKDEGFLKAMTAKYKEKIAVGVDVKDGYVAVNGWKEKTDIRGMAFCSKLRDIGVSTVIYTDISRDGGLKGTNMEVYTALKEIRGLDVIASGGISFEEEIKRLKSLVSGAILGKALYSGALDLEKCIELGERE